MGSLQASEFAAMDVDIETALAWHLRSNHYPPVPLTMVQPCIDAIDAAYEENWNKQIELPEGVFYKGETTAPAWAIVEQHHLDAWILGDDDE